MYAREINRQKLLTSVKCASTFAKNAVCVREGSSHMSIYNTANDYGAQETAYVLFFSTVVCFSAPAGYNHLHVKSIRQNTAAEFSLLPLIKPKEQ